MGTKNSGNKKRGTYYTNGNKEIKISQGERVPEGYYKGRLKSPITTKDMIRVTDGIKEKFISKTDIIPEGWYKGRCKKMKSVISKIGKSQRGKVWITNGKIEVVLRHQEELPKGFKYGRLPMTEEQKVKCSESHVGKKHSEETKKKISLHSNNNREKANRTIERKYGSKENFFNHIVEKVNETKIKNHTFNTSKLEKILYKELCEQYRRENVYRNYKSERYPYRCDFYIKSKDLFIELNAHWTHGEHPFDETNSEDIQTLNKWREKAKTSHFYEQAIDTWTRRDVEKLKCLRKNKLNFKIIYSNEIIEE